MQKASLQRKVGVLGDPGKNCRPTHAPIICTCLLFVGAFLLVGCGGVMQLSRSSSDLETRWEEQMDEYDRQSKRVEEQLDRADELDRRYEKLLAKWHEQNERFDKLLDKWEEQTRRMDAILDKLEKQQALGK